MLELRDLSMGETAESLDAALRRVTRAFAEAGLDTPQLDARVLLCAAADISREDLAREPRAPFAAAARSRLEAFTRRRLKGEPVARITGVKEFWGLEFTINDATLVPRPDSETLVETALGHMRGRDGDPLRIADLGTGSGCLIVALLDELKNAHGVATDISPAALSCAMANGARHGVADRLTTVCCDFAGALRGPFDAIVANPPYISSATIATLSREVAQFAPRAALDGGPDGLNAYRAIAPQAFALMAPSGILCMEVGEGQAEAVLDIACSAGFEPHAQAALAADLAGKHRVVSVSKSLMT